MMLLDVLPPPLLNPIGIGLAFGFFLVLIAVAFIVFKMLKRTVKMAFRMIIVVAILLIAMVGSLALFYGFGTTRPEYHGPARRPANTR